MSVHIITIEDLSKFKLELIAELVSIFKVESHPTLKYLKSQEVRKLLKISAGTLQTLRINGTLQYTQLGGILYYDFDHIQYVLKKNLHLATKI